MQISSPEVKAIYEEIKYWTAIGGLFFGVFKIVNWFKDLKTNDLLNIHTSVTELKAELKTQTSAIVTELQAQRSDFKTYFLFQQPKVRAARAGKRKKTPKSYKKGLTK